MKGYVVLFLIIIFGAFLRLYNVSNIPPGLYIDEISDAYNANQIITKGVDQYGEKYPLWFKAYGEYKMPMLVYADVVSISIFGRTNFAVRFPSILSGILSLFVFYFLTKQLVELSKNKFSFSSSNFALVSTLILAISPWHIQFSRGGFDAMLGLFFYLVSLLFAVIFFKKQRLSYLLLSFLFLAVTMYSYNVYRLIAPVTFLAILGAVIFYRKLFTREIFISCSAFLVLILPVVLFSLTEAGLERFSQTSAFSSYVNISVLEKIVRFPPIYLKNYLSYFSLQFLFNIGDGIGRHQIPNFGPMPYWEFPFLMVGLFLSIKNWKNSFYRTVLALLILAPISGALTLPSPHTLRSLLLVIPLTLMVSAGVLGIFKNLKNTKKIIFFLVLGIIILYENMFYLHFYYFHYPIVNSLDWGRGYEETVKKAMGYESSYEHIVVDQELGSFVTPLYFGFYSNDTLKPLIVPDLWEKTNPWQEGTTLYIHPYYKNKHYTNIIIDTVYLPGKNKDIFAQFRKL